MLSRNILRDIKENLLVNISCIILLVLGIAMYISFSTLRDEFPRIKTKFYNDYSFADVFANVISIDDMGLKSIEKINGVRKVNGRIVKDVKICEDGKVTEQELRITTTDFENENSLNKIKILTGVQINNDEKMIYLGEKFYTANNLNIGDEIQILVNGKIQKVKVAGAVKAPEYLYLVKNESEMFVDNSKFDFAYMSKNVAEDIFGMKGMSNDIVIKLDNNHKYEDIEDELKSMLKRYNILSCYDREDQVSNKLIVEETNQLDTMTTTVPFLFLIISLTIICFSIKRIIEKQRTQIGVLKAFGYTSEEIIKGYAIYSVIISTISSILGTIFGIYLSDVFFDIYSQSYNLPASNVQVNYKIIICFIIFVYVITLLVALYGARGVLKLEPADSMRLPPPKGSKHSFVERIDFIWTRLSMSGKMGIRNIFRAKSRNIFVMIGIAFAFAMLTLILSLIILMNQMIDAQLVDIKKYDLKVTFENLQSVNSAKNEFLVFDNVLDAEAQLAFPIVLKNGHITQDSTLMGLEDDSYMIGISEGEKVVMPKVGIAIPDFFAKKFKVKKGDKISIGSPYFDDDKDVYVTDITKQSLGLVCYMNLEFMQEFFDINNSCNSITLTTTGDFNNIEEKYAETTAVKGFEDKGDMAFVYKKLLESVNSLIYMLLGVCVFISFAIIYNAAVISISEREREITSLRVLGLTVKEINKITSTEQTIIAVIGCILGIGVAKLMLVILATEMSTDLYTFQSTLGMVSILTSFVATMTSLKISEMTLNKKMNSLDLVSILKDRSE